jgi:hypothetical protein
MFKKHSRKNLFLIIAGVYFFPQLAHALPPPPAVAELCKNSDFIVKGKYVGGMVGEVNHCEFWVTFQVKPEKYFKKPATGVDLKMIQFRKHYFEDTQQCARIPGPNAMPGDMKEKLNHPNHEKKVFFLKDAAGQIEDLSDDFWGIVDWNQAPQQWHEEFKAAPACHPLS